MFFAFRGEVSVGSAEPHWSDGVHTVEGNWKLVVSVGSAEPHWSDFPYDYFTHVRPNAFQSAPQSPIGVTGPGKPGPNLFRSEFQSAPQSPIGVTRGESSGTV